MLNIYLYTISYRSHPKMGLTNEADRHAISF